MRIERAKFQPSYSLVGQKLTALHSTLESLIYSPQKTNLDEKWLYSLVTKLNTSTIEAIPVTVEQILIELAKRDNKVSEMFLQELKRRLTTEEMKSLVKTSELISGYTLRMKGSTEQD